MEINSNRFYEINSENFNQSFNLLKILQNSIYYPASGIDAIDIELLNSLSDSFIHVDYGISLNEVKRAMQIDFGGIGYRVIGIKNILMNELIGTRKIQPYKDDLKQHEKNRLKKRHIYELYQQAMDEIHALWVVYELVEKKPSSKRMRNRFSLLHIKGEACLILENLYVNNKINPLAIVFWNPAEGYGDNWTQLTNTGYRFYNYLIKNSEKNNIEMPSFILSNCALPINETEEFWPQYKFSKKQMVFNQRLITANLYKYER